MLITDFWGIPWRPSRTEILCGTNRFISVGVAYLHFKYVWNNQFDIEIPFPDIRQRIFDVYLQKWYSDINNSNRLQSYCIYKHDFKLENYITDVTENKYKTALARFRTSSHNLFIKTGRYDNTLRHERICKSCNMNKIEDEYHNTIFYWFVQINVN